MIYFFRNPKPKTNLEKISSKNFLGNKLVKLAYEFAKLFTKTNSKMREPMTYNEAINNTIYKNK